MVAPDAGVVPVIVHSDSVLPLRLVAPVNVGLQIVAPVIVGDSIVAPDAGIVPVNVGACRVLLVSVCVSVVPHTVPAPTPCVPVVAISCVLRDENAFDKSLSIFVATATLTVSPPGVALTV